MFVLFAAFYLHLMLLFQDYFQSTFDIFNEKKVNVLINLILLSVINDSERNYYTYSHFKHSKFEARRPPKTSSQKLESNRLFNELVDLRSNNCPPLFRPTINTVKACLLTRNWTPLIGFKVFYCLRRRPSWSASECCANVTLWPSFV